MSRRAVASILLAGFAFTLGVGCAGSDGGGDKASAQTGPRFDSAEEASEAIRESVPSISEAAPITEDNDPNDLIGRPDGYVAAVVLVDPRSDDEYSLCRDGDIGVDCGATIEQWPDEAAAEQRADQIQESIAADPILPSEYGWVEGPILLRVSGYLKPSEAAEYEAAFTGDEPVSAQPSEPPYDASVATAEEKWAEYLRLVTEAGIAKRHWASTRADAQATEGAACSRTQEQMNGAVSLFRDIYTDADFDAERLFYTAYCPQQLPVFDAALAGSTEDPVEETSTSAAPVPVSMSTACQLLFPGRQQGELAKIADFILGNIEATPRTFRQFKGNVAEISDIATVAPDELAVHLDSLVGFLGAYIADLEATGSGTLDTTTYKAAGLEVSNICLNHL